MGRLAEGLQTLEHFLALFPIPRKYLHDSSSWVSVIDTIYLFKPQSSLKLDDDYGVDSAPKFTAYLEPESAWL